MFEAHKATTLRVTDHSSRGTRLGALVARCGRLGVIVPNPDSTLCVSTSAQAALASYLRQAAVTEDLYHNKTTPFFDESEMSIREASHAGSWYSSSKSKLSSELDGWLADVPTPVECIGPRSAGQTVDSLPVPGARVIIAP